MSAEGGVEDQKIKFNSIHLKIRVPFNGINRVVDVINLFYSIYYIALGDNVRL